MQIKKRLTFKKILFILLIGFMGTALCDPNYLTLDFGSGLPITQIIKYAITPVGLTQYDVVVGYASGTISAAIPVEVVLSQVSNTVPIQIHIVFDDQKSGKLIYQNNLYYFPEGGENIPTISNVYDNPSYNFNSYFLPNHFEIAVRKSQASYLFT